MAIKIYNGYYNNHCTGFVLMNQDLYDHYNMHNAI